MSCQASVETLTSGIVIGVWAHGFDVEGDNTVFEIMIRAKPNYLLEVLAIPTKAVADVRRVTAVDG
ncbi:MAG: hypothetical protein U0821_08610 [Chloroflexota bacterium]